MPYKMTRNGQTYYLAYNQVGSLRAVTAENGTIVKTIEYDTFGNVLSDSNESLKVPFGFAGGLYDPDTKLTRFGYRDYDAETGKWTAKDPIGFDGGDANLYGYVLGDPVGLVDPSGKSIWIIPPIWYVGTNLYYYGQQYNTVWQMVQTLNNMYSNIMYRLDNCLPVTQEMYQRYNHTYNLTLEAIRQLAIGGSQLQGTISGGPFADTTGSVVISVGIGQL